MTASLGLAGPTRPIHGKHRTGEPHGRIRRVVTVDGSDFFRIAQAGVAIVLDSGDASLQNSARGSVGRDLRCMPDTWGRAMRCRATAIAALLLVVLVGCTGKQTTAPTQTSSSPPTSATEPPPSPSSTPSPLGPSVDELATAPPPDSSSAGSVWPVDDLPLGVAEPRPPDGISRTSWIPRSSSLTYPTSTEVALPAPTITVDFPDFAYPPSPLVTPDGFAIVATGSGLVVVHPDGTVQQHVLDVPHLLAVTEGAVLVSGGRLAALRLPNLDPLWISDAGGSTHLTPPAIHRGVVYALDSRSVTAVSTHDAPSAGQQT